MMRFRHFTTVEGKRFWINLDHILWVKDATEGQVEIRLVNDYVVVVVDHINAVLNKLSERQS